LKVKEVCVDDRRYIICLNEKQARKDEQDRLLIIESLKEQLKPFTQYQSRPHPSWLI
jgi:hypothetical protein